MCTSGNDQLIEVALYESHAMGHEAFLEIKFVFNPSADKLDTLFMNWCSFITAQ